MTRSPLRVGVLASGGGRTALNLLDHIERQGLRAEIAAAVSSRCDTPAVERLRSCGMSVTVIERREHPGTAFDDAISACMSGVDLVCMCGFLSLWNIPREFEGRVLNIHPALLPAFGGRGMYGDRVHEAVLASGATMSGCTVHFCDNEYDHGPILLQRSVPVLPGDTAESLARRVFEAECVAYPTAVGLIAAGRVRIGEGVAYLLPKPLEA